MFAGRVYLYVALVVSLVLVSPVSPSVLGHSGGSPGSVSLPAGPRATSLGHPTVAPPSASVRAATEARILSQIQASHVPMKYAYLPNFNAEVSTHGGVVTPTYSHSPAPYGIAAYGVSNTTGTATPYILNSPSYEGQITFNSLDEFYLDDDSTDYIGAQLNTVVSNITLFGTTNYSYWNQNVITYSARSHLLQFIDNIWNFSSTAFYLSPNVFNQTGPNGTLVAPTFYYALGPVINITMPFTLDLYINATTTNVGGFPDDIVYFNYTVIKSGATVQAGTFDWAIFNSQNPASPTATIPEPEYQLNGFYPSPTGYLPYESELVFCGPGGGSTTTVRNLNATLNLWYLNESSGSYQTVPSAFAYGTNTGETIEGATEWFDATDTVHVGPGPTLPFPLWNGSPTAAPGHIRISGSVSPDTSFVFLNESAAFNYSWAAYAPVAAGGSVQYDLPSGDYVGEVLMANHDPTTLSITGSVPASWVLSVALTPDTSKGIYTPLIAFSNAQLGELAVSGAGTLANPYIMPTDAATSLDPIFGSINDFAFPVFPGLLFAHTTSYVLLNGSSTFHIDYGGRVLTYMERFGLPTSNNLQMQLYGTTHVSIMNTRGISGWFDGLNLNGFPLASLMLWNSSSTLVGGNVFSSQGTTILLYGGTGNTIWGNWFNMDPLLQNPAVAPILLAGTYALGPQVYENGDLIFNNAFLTQIPAYSPPSTIYLETFYSTFNSFWLDQWNVSAQPAGDLFTVNGMSFNGSIVNASYVGGNLWWDYVPGSMSLPWGGGGLVAVGGDWLPIVGDSLTFAETGLPAGTVWGFVLDGITVNTAGASVTMAFFDGTFAYAAFPVPGYTMSANGVGTVTLAGGAPSTVVVSYTFIPARYSLTFTETGLPASASWTVTVNGQSQTFASASIGFNETNGTYTWSVSHVPGLLLATSSGTVTVNGAAVNVGVTFATPPSPDYSVAVTESGLPAGTMWSVTLSGTTVSSQLDVISFSEPNGSYGWTVANVTGYTVAPASGTVTVAGGAANTAVVFTAAPVTLSGTINPTTAQVLVDGSPVVVSTPGTFSVHVAPGVHSVTVSASGYYTYYDNVSVPVGGSASLTIGLNPVSSGSSSAGLTGSNLALLAGVSLLALIFLLGMVYFWSKARRPPVVMKPETDASSGSKSS